jgi:hypothetical protein
MWLCENMCLELQKNVHEITIYISSYCKSQNDYTYFSTLTWYTSTTLVISTLVGHEWWASLRPSILEEITPGTFGIGGRLSGSHSRPGLAGKEKNPYHLRVSLTLAFSHSITELFWLMRYRLRCCLNDDLSVRNSYWTGSFKGRCLTLGCNVKTT